MVCIVFKLTKDQDEAEFPSGSFAFPKKYSRLVEAAMGHPVLYYRARVTREGGKYLAVALVMSVRDHPTLQSKLVADVSAFSPLRRAVHIYESGVTRERAFNERLNRSIMVRPVREIPCAELDAILEDSERPSVAERRGAAFGDEECERELAGLGEAEQTVFVAPPNSREYRYRRTLCRLPLRLLALRHFDGRCIFTSSRQRFDDGSFEVECCHIQPLDPDGPDVIQNVIPITRTFHKLFDMGLISLEDDLRILTKETVDPRLRGLLNDSGYATVPNKALFRASLPFVRYHRRYIYGASS